MRAGQILTFANDVNHEDLLPCDGSMYDANDFPELYLAIGTQFGGEGGHFAVPDLRGTVPKGLDDDERPGDGDWPDEVQPTMVKLAPGAGHALPEGCDPEAAIYHPPEAQPTLALAFYIAAQSSPC